MSVSSEHRYILVVNCGSTSVKLAVLDPWHETYLCRVQLERLGTAAKGRVTWSDDDSEAECAGQPAQALSEILPQLLEKVGRERIQGVGHRVVHGGDLFAAATVVNDAVAESIQQLSKLAPLHNPVNLAGIRAAQKELPNVPHVAVFDTSFHSTLPTRARLYALDHHLSKRHAIRRYGFHGTSHQFVARRAAAFLGEDLRELRVITCHLGGGCSLCAIEYGRSVETSMGMTPLEGVVMATRCGDLDPGILLHLLRQDHLDADQLEQVLNRESGLRGLSGLSGDMRDIETGAEAGDEQCRAALQVFCHRIRKYIGAYAAVMGGVDLIVFTGGIGENSAVVRHRVAQRLRFLGARIDEAANRDVTLTAQPVAVVSQPHSRVRLLTVKTDEMLAIAQQVQQVTHRADVCSQRTIPVAISARHVHLTQATVERLFGEGHQLTPARPLSQPGQFACAEEVTLVGPQRRIEGVRVLGPARAQDQVEISRTDEFYLGIDAPVRPSGQLENTPGITLLGRDGRRVELDKGVICALRHIHMTPADAELFGVEDGDMVDVEVGNEGVRSLTFSDVLIRVKDCYALEMHIDTDEGNAAELQPRDEGELEPTAGRASLKLRKSP